jgi:Leucine Rich repeat
MSTAIFALDVAPVSVKLVGACLGGLLPGILSGRLRTDGNTIAVPYLIACIAATTWLHQVMYVDPGLIAIFLGLLVGFVVFVLAPSKKASVFAATTITVVALAGIGFVALLRMPPAEMRRAIAHIRDCGGVVEQSDDFGTTYQDQWLVTFEHRALDDDQLLRVAPDLRKLPKLWLKLSGCPVGDRGLSGLEHADNLVWLDLDGTRVTDSGLPHLSDLGHLERLDLSGTQVSDAGLHSLSKLARLETLLLQRDNVTEVGVEELQRSLRKCDIVCTGRY